MMIGEHTNIDLGIDAELPFQMCENRYLHLPVVAEGSGEVLGVVDVMEIIQATVGQEGSSG